MVCVGAERKEVSVATFQELAVPRRLCMYIVVCASVTRETRQTTFDRGMLEKGATTFFPSISQ